MAALIRKLRVWDWILAGAVLTLAVLIVATRLDLTPSKVPSLPTTSTIVEPTPQALPHFTAEDLYFDCEGENGGYCPTEGQRILVTGSVQRDFALGDTTVSLAIKRFMGLSGGQPSDANYNAPMYWSLPAVVLYDVPIDDRLKLKSGDRITAACAVGKSQGSPAFMMQAALNAPGTVRALTECEVRTDITSEPEVLIHDTCTAIVALVIQMNSTGASSRMIEEVVYDRYGYDTAQECVRLGY